MTGEVMTGEMIGDMVVEAVVKDGREVRGMTEMTGETATAGVAGRRAGEEVGRLGADLRERAAVDLKELRGGALGLWRSSEIQRRL
mmetsp:Transcript_16987/g.30198  ORF Transcript_16987/g.30198 Transcript_16987/m.30198 type:complete len:86 (-) Transcript_16987:282-539(-)